VLKTFQQRKGKDKEKRCHAEIQICPKCLSSKIQRMSASSGDMTGALAILPPKFVCLKCGWVGRLVIMRDVEISDNAVDEMNGIP
jgi:hypothetical protein